MSLDSSGLLNPLFRCLNVSNSVFSVMLLPRGELLSVTF